MKKQPQEKSTTVSIVDERTKYWQIKDVRKRTITIEKGEVTRKKSKSDEVDPNKMWRQVNTWIVIGK